MKRIFTSLIILLLYSLQSCSLVFPVIAPFKDLPKPTGPYSVATRSTAWTDSSRDETFTVEIDQRRIVVQVWYPTKEKISEPSTYYVDDPVLRLPALAKQLRLPVFVIKHFDKVKTNSFLVKDGQSTEHTFPVILFSHGLSGMRFQNSSLMEELASQGYVVLAADHSYGANITIFPDGNIAEYRVGTRRVLTEERLEEVDLSQLSIVVRDMSFIIDQLNQHPEDPFLRNLPVDPDHIGVLGHSLGGAAIINLAAVDERVDAALALDTWYIPVPDSVLEAGMNKPIFHLGQKDWSDPYNYKRMNHLMNNCTGPVLKLLIPETRHADYTDMPLFSPFSRYIGYTAATDPERLNALIRAASVSFFDAYLKGASIEPLRRIIQTEKEANSYIFIPLEKAPIPPK
ncbi:MAG: dienelactone hydrolase family protein [Candidatus Marinimicrobia bacterium]|nr:dienelactone hydrolase family protein [Candidatus Neomarinimicrobiota bacterium]